MKGAYGFDSNRLFCKWELKTGIAWYLLNGKEKGETYEEIKDETDEYSIWDHPFDIHYKARSMRGWPKFVIEVWEVDTQGRYSLAGYGLGTIPCTPGQHLLKIKCWRPLA